MKKMIVLGALLASCGYSSRDNELIGQVKKVVDKTPLVCGDYTAADISLGVMRNGVGSMSAEDVWVYVRHESDRAVLKRAAETGALVKVFYDVKRVAWCVPDHYVTRVELLEERPATTEAAPK